MPQDLQPPSDKVLKWAKDAWLVRVKHNSAAIELLAGLAPVGDDNDLALAAFLLGLCFLPAEVAWCLESGEFR